MTNQELTYDLLLPDPIPLRFQFGDKYPDLVFEIRADYNLKETKILGQLSERWANYFEQPTERETDRDTERAKKVMYGIIELAAPEFDYDALHALPEPLQLRIFTIIGKHIRELLDDSPAEDDGDFEGYGRNPNEGDQDQSAQRLQPLQAPMAESLVNG